MGAGFCEFTQPQKQNINRKETMSKGKRHESKESKKEMKKEYGIKTAMKKLVSRKSSKKGKK